jgi:acyl carrier protein
MEESEILKTLEEILKAQKGFINFEIDKNKKITPETKLREDLGMDSLDTYEWIFVVEEGLGISIPDEKANEFETIRDYINYIKDYPNRHTI